jgi:serine phosphatase RsbU (regulator of sigma subunit)
MEIQIAVAKTNKFGSIESGDSLEVIERPSGGLSVVMCDGQVSGQEAKMISGMVVRKVISLISDGIRDGSAARAASDFLFTERKGQFPVFLNILSADLQTGTLVLTRNNPTPIFVAQGERVECLSGSAQPIGTTRNIRPSVSEISLIPGTTVVMYTDGLSNAGTKDGGLGLDICTALEAVLDEQQPSAQMIADSLLSQAIRLDHGRADDDMSVVCLRVLPYVTDLIRRLTVRFPIPQERDCD